MLEPTLGTVIGPFTIIDSLPTGSGGMSLVYLASVNRELHKDLANIESLPDRVALKIARVLPPDQIDSPEQSFYFEALNNEVETLKRLRHPNIVRVFPIPRGLPRNPYTARAADLEGSPWYCAMEYLGGGSLESYIREAGALPLGTAIEIAFQIGLALDHIHAKGMAHLDLKPDNILFRFSPFEDRRVRLFQPVLIDFGIAAKMSKAGPHAGSLPFMSPERVSIMRGEIAPEQYGDQTKADSYGMGVLLYRMLTGKLPFEGLPRDELTDAILKTNPRRPSEIQANIPIKVDEIVMNALAKDPDQRPRIEEIITRLDEASITRPPSPPVQKRAPAQRIPTPTLLSISGVVALAMLICFFSSFTLGTWASNSYSTTQKPVPTLMTPDFSTDTPTPELKTATPTLAASPTPLPPTATATPPR